LQFQTVGGYTTYAIAGDAPGSVSASGAIASGFGVVFFGKTLDRLGEDYDKYYASQEDALKYWLEPVEVEGVKVYQRDDLIDPSYVDKEGRTNLDRMKQGIAPIGPDGESIELHHMLQTNNSPIAEIAQTFHQQNKKIIHINPNTIPSGIDRKAFAAWKRKYWKIRAEDFM